VRGGGGSGGTGGTATSAGGTYGGGGGGDDNGTGAGNGGPGGVRIRYLTADLGSATGGTITVDGAHTYHDFTTSGSFVATAPAARMRDAIGGGVGQSGPRNK
jgi:hypothetical protein